MPKSKKTIAVYPINSGLHSLYKPTIELLSKKYNLVYNPPDKDRFIMLSDKIKKYPKLRLFYYKFIRPFFSLNNLQNILKRKKEEKINADLLFCSGTLPPKGQKFVLNIGTITCLGGFDYNRLNKKEIEERLASEDCKAVICWYQITKDSMLSVLDCTKFREKIHVVPFAVESHKVKKKFHNPGEVQLLLVSSMNYPFDFDLKGGVIALEAYKILLEKYPNLKFIIKSSVPKWVKEKYGSLPGIKIIENMIPRKELDNLMLESDILLEPFAGTQLMLECLDSALPVVAFDAWEVPEIIIDGKNGLLVDGSSIFGNRNNLGEYIKTHQDNYVSLHSEHIDPAIVKEFARKTSKLIESKSLREKMGKNAKSMIKPGKLYSPETRNKKLLKIINKAIL